MTQRLVGQRNYHAGLAAEAIAARAYTDQGFVQSAARWRGATGEIDLIMTRGSQIVFVEVKTSRTLSGAADMLSMRQLARIQRAAEEYLARSGLGLDTDCRVDLAVVDQTGQTKVIENITLH